MEEQVWVSCSPTACSRVKPHMLCWVTGEHLPSLSVLPTVLYTTPQKCFLNGLEIPFTDLFCLLQRCCLPTDNLVWCKTLGWHEKDRDSNLRNAWGWYKNCQFWSDPRTSAKGTHAGLQLQWVNSPLVALLPGQMTSEVQQTSAALIFRKLKKIPDLHGAWNAAAKNRRALFETFLGLKQIKTI